MMSWDDEHSTLRLWARDASLWTSTDESQWMGWLDAVGSSLSAESELTDFADEIRREGVRHILLLGMGGSSLCARVFQKTFGATNFLVLDSTDPAQIRACESQIDLNKTLCLVSSKSGSTLETQLLFQHFRTRVKHFVAITDPDSPFEKTALDSGFRKIFHGIPPIGGRYSALSNFGMVPAALMGLDLKKLLGRAYDMFHACGPTLAEHENPGVMLGKFLGENAALGQDKLTLLISPQMLELGSWLEQLIAESTGKNGKGIIPIDREKLQPPEHYGSDRIFAYIRLNGDSNAELDAFAKAVEKVGHPVFRITCHDLYDLGAEFFRWEFATAVAGSILGINPFNQPDVEATKKATTLSLTARAETSELPWIPASAGMTKIGLTLAELLNSIKEDDYFSICAFIEMNDAHEAILQEIRNLILAHKRVATSLGFGPCFLHSTGQLHKGGPNTGVFLQITCDDAIDIEIAEQKFSFSLVKEAQANADLSVLLERGRRCSQHHIRGDLMQGLVALKTEVQSLLQSGRG